jgi:hypothetical protein
MNQAQDFSVQDSENRFKTQPGNLQLFLIAIIVVMLSVGPTAVLKVITETGPWGILPVLVAICAFEGAWTTRWLGRAPRGLNRLFYRLAEVFTLVILITLIYWLSPDIPGRGNMIDNFLAAPLSLFSFNLIVLMALCLLAWAWSNVLTGIFSKLAMSNDEIEYFTTPSTERLRKGIAPIVPVYRIQLYHDFIRHWSVGGLLLAFFSILATIEFTSGNIEAMQTFDFRIVTRLGLPSELLLALIIYFGVGFWLASQARMAVMQARWVAGGIEIETSITTRWRRQVLIIIIVVSVLAAFLPIGSTLAISEIIQVVLSYLLAALTILLGLVPLIFAWLLSLFSSGTPTNKPDQLPADISPPVTAGEISEPIFEIPTVLLEGLFLVAMVVIALMALVYFFRYRSLRFDLAWLTVPISRFVSQLGALWRRFSMESTDLAASIRIRLERVTLPGRKTRIPWRFSPIRGQTPREKIRQYYLSILYRAEKQGVTRAPSETPLEHEENLINNWPEATSEISDLTQIFLQARYSRRPITVQETEEAKTVFQRLRTTVRKKVDAGSPKSEPRSEPPESSLPT